MEQAVKLGAAAGAVVSQEPLLVLRPRKGWQQLGLKDLWQYRELLYFLCWRDIKVRYKQTALGVAWAILQPVMTMLLFSLFFGRLAKMPSDGIPYPLFVYTALVPWMFFSSGITQSSGSLVENASLLKKVYFPRLAVPIASVVSGSVDFLCSFVVLIAMMLYYGIVPSLAVLWLPFFLILACTAALGVGLWLSALNVQYRDVRYVIPFLTQLWLFATPIAYPSSLLSEPLRTLYGLNPMVGVVEGFRWALLGTETSPGPMLLVSSLASVVLMITGAFYFRRMEVTFSDRV
ncbi:MAG: ABC transporter permease [Nitrospira sp.]|nr:ABC transporter permease [Nitrospira sp.]MCI1279210.1 ABC transporter permease [Nitrospira sp.]HQY58816.1 ABC transporter permease [Nitrospira sp.]HRA95301.1 ABC transporter permease [Nitrospira sp.]